MAKRDDPNIRRKGFYLTWLRAEKGRSELSIDRTGTVIDSYVPHSRRSIGLSALRCGERLDCTHCSHRASLQRASEKSDSVEKQRVVGAESGALQTFQSTRGNQN